MFDPNTRVTRYGVFCDPARPVDGGVDHTFQCVLVCPACALSTGGAGTATVVVVEGIHGVLVDPAILRQYAETVDTTADFIRRSTLPDRIEELCACLPGSRTAFMASAVSPRLSG